MLITRNDLLKGRAKSSSTPNANFTESEATSDYKRRMVPSSRSGLLTNQNCYCGRLSISSRQFGYHKQIQQGLEPAVGIPLPRWTVWSDVGTMKWINVNQPPTCLLFDIKPYGRNDEIAKRSSEMTRWNRRRRPRGNYFDWARNDFDWGQNDW